MNATDTDTGDRLARTLNPDIAARRIALGVDSEHDRYVVREYGTAAMRGTVRPNLSAATGADTAADAAVVAAARWTVPAARGWNGTVEVPAARPAPRMAGITRNRGVYA